MSEKMFQNFIDKNGKIDFTKFVYDVYYDAKDNLSPFQKIFWDCITREISALTNGTQHLEDLHFAKIGESEEHRFIREMRKERNNIMREIIIKKMM